MLHNDINVFTQSGKKQIFLFQEEKQNINNRDLATWVKGTGGGLRSEMADRKHKTGFDRQKVNNKR